MSNIVFTWDFFFKFLDIQENNKYINVYYAHITYEKVETCPQQCEPLHSKSSRKQLHTFNQVSKFIGKISRKHAFDH